MEKWEPVPEAGFESRYQVSSYGRVRAMQPKNGRQPGHVMKIQHDQRGRPQVTMWDGKRHKTVRVAVLVARRFLPPLKPGQEICHEDGDDQNCRADNLRNDTHAANIMDSVQQGTHRSVRKTSCRYGHPLDGLRKDSRTRKMVRYCKTCSRVSARGLRRSDVFS